MEIEQSFDAIKKSYIESGSYLLPAWNSYCYSKIPGTVKRFFNLSSKEALPKAFFSSFGNKPFDFVVIIHIDAFGWRFLDEFRARIPEFNSFMEESVTAKLTSQFPSTTACHLSTFYTEVPAFSHPIYEWYIYEPTLNRTLAPLLFSFAEDDKRETLKGTVDPKDLFPEPELARSLSAHNINYCAYMSEAYSSSSFNQRVLNGAVVCPFKNSVHGFEVLKENISGSCTRDEPAYHSFYIDTFDEAVHLRGPRSAAAFEEFKRIFFKVAELERSLAKSLKGKRGCLCITADHGAVSMNPGKTVYLDKECPWILDYIRLDARGLPVLPAGSPRDLFIHLKDSASAPEIREKLALFLEERALVLCVDDLVKGGIYPSLSPKLKAGLGDLVVLPKTDTTVFWLLNGGFVQHFLGHHGGLSPHEMEIPFVVKELA